MRRASVGDIPLLVSLMSEFYGEAGYRLNGPRAAEAFAALLADERLGYIWIIEAEGEDVGHLVLTLRYGMEYCGSIACLDDLYVKPRWRNQGLAGAALTQVRAFCEKAAIRAVTVEVGFVNRPAQKVYRRVGFAELADRQLLGMPLAAPAHD